MTEVDQIIAACCVEELDRIHEELCHVEIRTWSVTIGDLLPQLRRVREQLCGDKDSIQVVPSHALPSGVAVALGPADEAGNLEVKGVITNLATDSISEIADLRLFLRTALRIIETDCTDVPQTLWFDGARRLVEGD